MNPSDFQFVADMLKRRSGLALKADKIPLVNSRFAPLAERHGFADVASFVRKLRTADEGLARAATDAMTVNESWFFRDEKPFDCFRDRIVPALCKARARQRRLRIWSAGAATGQEPYSLAMILEEMRQQLGDWAIDVFATDINAEVVARAQEGLYDEFEVQRGLPLSLLARHFRREGDNWRLSRAIRERVQFRVFNLLESFKGLGPFDVIFCRNVLIYFGAAAKDDVLRRLSACLAPDGYLVLGAAEMLLDCPGAFERLPGARGIYTQGLAANARPLVALAG